MFGRRTPDRPNNAPSAPHKAELDLGMLDDLPELIPTKVPAPQPPPQPPQEEGWASSLLGPSVTQLLREAEVAGQPEITAAAPIAPEVPATPTAAVTQQLPALDLEPAFAAVHDQLWAATELETAQPLAPDASAFATYHNAEVAEPPQAEAVLPTMPSTTEAAIAQPWENQEPVVASEVATVDTTSVPTPPAPATPARTVAESVIGPDDFFDGHYRSERGVRIQGNARGSIESRQYILVEVGAQVEADLAAEEIMVAGTFTGNITCHGKLEITDTGVVQGVITTASLVVQQGGTIDGELRMRRNEG